MDNSNQIKTEEQNVGESEEQTSETPVTADTPSDQTPTDTSEAGDETAEETTRQPEVNETAKETPAENEAAEPEAEETNNTSTTEPQEESEAKKENTTETEAAPAPKDQSAEQPAPAGDPSATPQDDPDLSGDDKKEGQDAKKNDNPNARWYVVHTYSGHENKVAHTLKQRIESEHLGDRILDVLVPMQEKIEIKGGKKVNIKEKIFPGYILVKMVLDDISWLAVRTTQGVTSFVGMGNKPTPISEAEVQTIVKFTQSEAPMYKQVFTTNDTVKIVDGPFADFIGKIDSVDEEKGKVRVLVSIFGRETPVELDFLQIKKI